MHLIKEQLFILGARCSHSVANMADLLQFIYIDSSSWRAEYARWDYSSRRYRCSGISESLSQAGYLSSHLDQLMDFVIRNVEHLDDQLAVKGRIINLQILARNHRALLEQLACPLSMEISDPDSHTTEQDGLRGEEVNPFEAEFVKAQRVVQAPTHVNAEVSGVSLALNLDAWPRCSGSTIAISVLTTETGFHSVYSRYGGR